MNRVNTGDVNVARTASGAFVAAPPAIDIHQKAQLDLYKVAYYRSEPAYDELIAALFAKVADLKEQLRSLQA